MRILTNARIYTLDPENPIVSTLVIDHGMITAVGEKTSALAAGSLQTELVDLGGRTVIPGLTDAHIHLQYYSLGLKKVDCETNSQTECLERVAARARQTPPAEWILGHGWNQNNWPEGYGSCAQLDRITTEQPIYLTAKSLHAGWGNTTALRLAGITSQTPDPPGGRIQRDEHGVPTGILFEKAMALVENSIPEAKPAMVAQAIKDAQPLLWQMGLTGAHDFDRQTCFTALQLLHEAGDLKLRVTKSLPIEILPEAVEIGLRSGFGDDFLQIGSIKAFSDGALGPRTAAMLQPYEGEPDNRGIAMLDAEEIFEKGRLAVEHGLSLAIHAIGDRANHEVLDAYTQLRQVEQEYLPTTRRRLRHRIEHVQLIHPDDAERLARLGIIASMQPIHAVSDYPMADRYWGKRAAHAYAWRTISDYGTLMAFGSDAPVESPNPFWGLHAAVTRRRPDGSPGPDGWYPAQRLTLTEALHGFTSGAAYAAGKENQLGKLAPGYLADLIVLDTDLFNCEIDQIRDIRPTATMINGEWVYTSLSS